MRSVTLILALLLFLAVPAFAQDDPIPAPALPSVDALQTAVAEAWQAADRADSRATDAERYAGDASRFLGLFEAFSVVIAVAATALGVFGVTRLFSAQNELAKARENVETELAEMRLSFESQVAHHRSELQTLRDQLLASVEKQRQLSAQTTLAQALLPVGERQYRAQDLNGAAETYKRALELDADNPLLHYRLGYVSVQSGQLEDAEHHMKRALEIDPQFVLATAALGYVYRRMAEKMPEGIERDQRFNKSEAHLLDALKISPRLVDDDGESWWGSLGGLYRRRGQIDQAIYAYDQAGKVTPHSSYPFSNLALLYMDKGDRDETLRMYKRVERLAHGEAMADVDNFWAYADLLTSRLAQGKVDEAEGALRYVFNSAPPDSPYALETLADTLTRLAALSDAEIAAGIQPFIARIHARKP